GGVCGAGRAAGGGGGPARAMWRGGGGGVCREAPRGARARPAPRNKTPPLFEIPKSRDYGFRRSQRSQACADCVNLSALLGRNDERTSMPLPLADRIALVTGASRGIGYATALALAKAGAHIVALARTVGGLEELDDAIKAFGGSATLVPLDLKDYEGIDRLGLALHERFRRLDVMIGKAGILGPRSPPRPVQAQAWDEVMAVNVTANWRLIRAMDRLLQRSDAGRVVFISSGVAALALAYWGPYAVSKAALEALARTYAAETQTTNLRINVFT